MSQLGVIAACAAIVCIHQCNGGGSSVCETSRRASRRAADVAEIAEHAAVVAVSEADAAVVAVGEAVDAAGGRRGCLWRAAECAIG